LAGRPVGSGAGVRLTEAHRAKIQNSNILNALIEHAEGTRDMSATQVSAALGLLKKALPDLSAVAMEATHDITDTMAEVLKEIAARGGSLVKLDDDSDA
jgi:hypothetical protein